MYEFTVLIKEYAKSPWMTYFFQRHSEVCIWWTQTWGHGRGFVNGSEAATDAGRSHVIIIYTVFG